MHHVYLTQNTNRVHVTGTSSPGSVVNVCKTAIVFQRVWLIAVVCLIDSIFVVYFLHYESTRVDLQFHYHDSYSSISISS